MKNKYAKPVLCIGFDGVCTTGFSGWEGVDAASDGPTDGLFEFLDEATRVFSVQIYEDARSGSASSRRVMRQWFERHLEEWAKDNPERKRRRGEAVRVICFPDKRPVAHAYIGLRNVQYAGSWPGTDALLDITRWRYDARARHVEWERRKSAEEKAVADRIVSEA